MAVFCFWISLFIFVLSQSILSESVLLGAKPLTESAPFVLLGLRKFIARMDLEGGDFGVYLYGSSGVVNVFDLDTDIRESRIFWVDKKMKHLKKGVIDHTYNIITNVTTLLEADTVIEGLAWDWVNFKLYWTTVESYDDTVESTIQVMDTHTGCRSLLSVFGDGTRAGSIVLDPIRSWIFWGDTNETTSKIVRMAMDGTSYSILVEDDIIFPTGLSLDYATQTLFWIDAGTDKISSIGIDGTQRKIIADLEQYYNMPNPFGLEFYGGQLYFGDRTTDTVLKLTSLGSNKNLTTLQSFVFDPTVIHVLDIARQPMRPGIRPCSKNNGGCAFLCLPKPFGYSCFSPDNRLTCKQTIVTKSPIEPRDKIPVKSSSASGTPRIIGALLVAIAVMTIIIV